MRGRLLIAVAASLGAAATAVLPAAPAAAAATHIGIVVRYASGSVGTACASAGGNGLTVLKRKFTVVIGQQPPYAGFVFKINNVGTTRPDTTHYWAYWHLANGKWTYSSAGAGTYTPKAGTVEGWSYVNGTSAATAPPVRSSAALCGALDPKPAPATTPRRSATPPPVAPEPVGSATHAMRGAPPASSTSAGRRAGGTGPPRAAASSARGTSGPATPKSSMPHTATPRRTSAHSTSAPRPSPTGTPSPSTSPVAARHGADPTHPASTGFPAWGTGVALVAVALLGGAAWLRIRRQSS